MWRVTQSTPRPFTRSIRCIPATPAPAELRAYSGTYCQEFDFARAQGDAGRLRESSLQADQPCEFHKWKKTEFGYDEEYVGDIFSTNLSFIPVDLRYGPRGAMYVCDWYNPIKATRNTRCATNAAIARVVAFGEPTQGASLTPPARRSAGEGFACVLKRQNTATVTGPSANYANACHRGANGTRRLGEGAGFRPRAIGIIKWRPCGCTATRGGQARAARGIVE